MDTDERRRVILAMARGNGFVSVSAAAFHLAVSPETVRRDLSRLEEHGLVRRTHGGARPAAPNSADSAAGSPRMAGTTRVAVAAARLLGDARAVFIDQGHLPMLTAAALPGDRPLTVVTSSLLTATALLPQPHLRVLQAPPTGPAPAVDVAFLGADGICRAAGVTATDSAAGEVRARALLSAGRTVLVGGSGMFGRVGGHHVAHLGAIETIVTDRGLSPSEAQRYSARGPRVIRV
ncbi:DeoR/GlpR family DNA-binding transcription regulator [Streptomyces sp. NPDC056656]|uniref:DeoR/GlpR family DNA-binding transcription regulator n=1 Tax=Streptomyces sp. NPDC056656 TaxID=3345895 RepID=UPI0036837AA3